jgi:hypothetical protein
MEIQITYDPYPMSTRLREGTIIDQPHRIMTTDQIEPVTIVYPPVRLDYVDVVPQELEIKLPLSR